MPHARVLPGIFVLTLLSGCASAGSPAATTSPAPQTGATFNITIPAEGLKAKYVSAASRSVWITADGGMPVITDVAAGGTYSIKVPVKAGSHDFEVRLYDAAGGAGNQLSRKTLTGVAISATGTNAIGVVPAGVVASIQLSHAASLTRGQVASFALSVTAKDAAGNVIVGSYDNPITVTSGSSGLSLSGAAVSGSSDAITVSYDGSDTGTVSFSASAAGVNAANVQGASISPVVVTVNGGVVSTFVGLPNVSGSTDATGTAARFNSPIDVAVDGGGNLYVADFANHVIRKVTSAGVTSRLAGSGTPGTADGSANVAQLYYPRSLAVDASGNVYVADSANHRIRKITPAGDVTTLAGSTQGNADGTGAAAHFNNPSGMAVDGSGNVYVGDRLNHRIRKVTPAGVVTTFAGSISGTQDGTGTGANFNEPFGVAIDAAGTLYVTDYMNQRIRKVTAGGVVTTLAGGGPAGKCGGTSSANCADGTGSAARFYYPQGIAVDATGTVYVGDNSNQLVRKVTAAGVVTTLAGQVGVSGFGNGTGTGARFDSPSGVAVDANGNVYVADASNHVIRKIQ